MSDLGGGDGPDRPRWEGFPGGVDPLDPSTPVDPNATGPISGAGGYQPPEPPQFPYEQPAEQTAEIPIIGESPLEPPLPAAAAGGAGRRRAHAAPKPHTSRYVAFACAGAVLVIGGGLAFAGCNSDDVATTGVVAPVAPLGVPSSTPTQSLPSNSPIATDSVSPSTSSTASGSAKASSSASATASKSATATATPVAEKQALVVLNSTTINGLAKRVAANVEAKGWTVTKTANWTGAKPSSTTIYYLPGKKNKASADLFDKKFGLTSVVKPALPGMTSNLTLVITSDAA